MSANVQGVSASTVAYGLHTLFNSTTHGVYGKGWSDACLFVAERLRAQEGADDASHEDGVSS